MDGRGGKRMRRWGEGRGWEGGDGGGREGKGEKRMRRGEGEGEGEGKDGRGRRDGKGREEGRRGVMNLATSKVDSGYTAVCICAFLLCISCTNIKIMKFTRLTNL